MISLKMECYKGKLYKYTYFFAVKHAGGPLCRIKQSYSLRLITKFLKGTK